jgi:hypothetical protein
LAESPWFSRVWRKSHAEDRELIWGIRDKPVLDDAPYRSFETMADYRRWCEDNLPSWLGYRRV